MRLVALFYLHGAFLEVLLQLKLLRTALSFITKYKFVFFLLVAHEFLFHQLLLLLGIFRLVFERYDCFARLRRGSKLGTDGLRRDALQLQR